LGAKTFKRSFHCQDVLNRKRALDNDDQSRLLFLGAKGRAKIAPAAPPAPKTLELATEHCDLSGIHYFWCFHQK
jgi:hypothetical protein